MLEGGHEDVASNRMVRKDSLKKTPTAELPSQFGFVGGGKGQKEKERENPPAGSLLSTELNLTTRSRPELKSRVRCPFIQ